MKEIILKNIEKALLRIALSLEKKNITQLNFKIDEKSSVFIWDPDENYLKAVNKVNYLDLELLKGIDHQKEVLYQNTLNFSKGYQANNALLWGAKGAGKSSLIKSIFFSIINNSKNKLSLIEINREDLESLPKLLNLIKNLKRQFILYCDDLSFEKSETKFKSLKSVLEGGIEGKPNNVVFYATSNIRHLISSNSTEMEQLNTVAQKDHLNETISLSDRFGLWIGFHNIDQNTYLEIINSYLKYFEIEDANNEIRENSLKWSIQRGSRSGRVAWQYIVDVAGKLEKKISF